MAANPIPAVVAPLLALAEDAADGAHTFQAGIGLKQNLEVNIRADITALRTAEQNYAAAKTAKDTFSSNLQTADSNGRAFIKAASALFKQVISESWSDAWAATGFPDGSTAIPTTQEERLTLLGALRGYFTANPTKEISTATLVITAAKADTLFTALSDARAAVNNGNTDSGNKKAARDAALGNLQNRLRGLIAELGQLLGDNDPRWDAFGLNEPGASATPDVPEGLVVTPGTGHELHADWADARRATRYRVWKQVVTVDADFVAFATVNDSNATLAGLPVGKTVKIRVTAANDAGESVPSAEVQVVVA